MTPKQLTIAPDGIHQIHGNLYARKFKGVATFILKNARTPIGARTILTCHLGKFPQLSISKAIAWQRVQEAKMVEILLNRRQDIKPIPKITFGQLIEKYFEYCDSGIGNKRAWSLRTYRANFNRVKRYLHPHPLWNTSLVKIERAHLREFYVGISKLANNQAYKIYHFCNPALKKAVDLFDGVNCADLVFSELPFIKAKAIKQPGLGFADKGQAIKAMFVAIDKEKVFTASKLALKTIMLTCQRPGEICQMRKDQYDGRHLINYRQNMKVKTRGWDIRIPVQGELKKILDIAMQLNRDSPYLFPSFSGQKRARGFVSETAVQQLCKKVSKGACVPHGFRTSLTSYAIQIRKLPANSVDWILDHVRTDMTNQSYVNHSEGSPLAVEILLQYQQEIAG